jgi:aryl-alcohol dehydrogenase-like predicted oxidoreductase
MIKRALGNTGYEISPVAYGGIVSMSDGQAASDRYVSYAVDHGINYFDVAPSYGDAQEKLGNSLVPYRKSVYLACKTGQRNREGSQTELEESLRMLKTDYFDNYQLHALSTFDDIDAAFGPNGAMETLIRAKEKGLTRKLGITCHNEDVALKALSLYDFDTVLFPLNWGLSLGKNFGMKIAKTAKEKGIGLLGMKALIHRAWENDEERNASRFPKSWCMPISDNDTLGIAAMKYALSLGADTLIPPGNFESFSFMVEHIEDCINHPLTEDDVAYLKEELKKIDGKYFF